MAAGPLIGGGADGFLAASIRYQRSSPIRFAHDLPRGIWPGAGRSGRRRSEPFRDTRRVASGRDTRSVLMFLDRGDDTEREVLAQGRSPLSGWVNVIYRTGHMRTFFVGLLIAGSLALLSGCGGSSNSKLSYSAFSNAANKICTTANSQDKAVKGTSGTANAASAAGIGKVVTIDDKALSQLKALSGPGALETARDTFIAATKSSVVLAEKAEAAAKAGNQTDYVSAVKALAASDKASKPAANSLGAPACVASA